MKEATNQVSLKEALKEMLEVYRLKAKLNQTKINAVWSKLMGSSINKYTREIKLRRNKLYITIESASLRQELSYGKDKIIKIINEELGENYIEEVSIRKALVYLLPIVVNLQIIKTWISAKRRATLFCPRMP